jgi:hypothetical protein
MLWIDPSLHGPCGRSDEWLWRSRVRCV